MRRAWMEHDVMMIVFGYRERHSLVLREGKLFKSVSIFRLSSHQAAEYLSVPSR